LRGYFKFIIGRKARISENPMKEIMIAAELEAILVASIATPAPDVVPYNYSAISVIYRYAFGST